MAVQAQYPSNLLLLNTRNVQDPKTADYSSLQPQQPAVGAGAGGAYINQSHHVLFNNGGVSNSHNSRKRGRDVSSNIGPMNTFSFQPASHESSQFINLSQLHNHQHHHQNVVSTGLRLAFTDQNQLQNHHHQQPNQEQSMNYSSSNTSSSSLLVSLLSGDISNQIRQHRDELDQFLQTQGDEFRRTLADKRHKHYRTLLTAAEESISLKLKEKSAEAEKSLRRNAELEARAAQLSMEAQLWQAKARQTEVTAASLQAQLHHAIINGGCVQNANYQNDDGMTCAVGAVNEAGNADDAESAHVDPDRVLRFTGPVCKACVKRGASVLLLPCRHLCVCTGCDPLLQACPVCLTMKDSSVEVFLS